MKNDQYEKLKEFIGEYGNNREDMGYFNDCEKPEYGIALTKSVKNWMEIDNLLHQIFNEGDNS